MRDTDTSWVNYRLSLCNTLTCPLPSPVWFSSFSSCVHTSSLLSVKTILFSFSSSRAFATLFLNSSLHKHKRRSRFIRPVELSLSLYVHEHDLAPLLFAPVELRFASASLCLSLSIDRSACTLFKGLGFSLFTFLLRLTQTTDYFISVLCSRASCQGDKHRSASLVTRSLF